MTKSDVSFIGDPKFGIKLFKNILRFDFDVVEQIELLASGEYDGECKWRRAHVGYGVELPSYRNCLDWKPNDDFVKSIDTKNKFVGAYKTIKNTLIDCVEEYCVDYGISMGFMEVMNFIKYYEGGIFQSHSDDGYSYLASVSTIAYLNDGYEGGDLKFTLIGETVKPEFGDVLVFPSNFIYKHSSEPIINGTKYCVVTMFDYDRHEFLKSNIRASKQMSIERANW